MSDKLKTAVETILDEIQTIGIDHFEDALLAALDDMETGDKPDDLYINAVVDGIRWGARAAVVVEFDGGAMIRVIRPGGECFTLELSAGEATDARVDAVMAALVKHQKPTKERDQ